jgi:hypothetical protein
MLVPIVELTFGRLVRVNCKSGEVAEWLMAPVLKTGVPERVPGVRIPPSPPDLYNHHFNTPQQFTIQPVRITGEMAIYRYLTAWRCLYARQDSSALSADTVLELMPSAGRAPFQENQNGKYSRCDSITLPTDSSQVPRLLAGTGLIVIYPATLDSEWYGDISSTNVVFSSR